MPIDRSGSALLQGQLFSSPADIKRHEDPSVRANWILSRDVYREQDGKEKECEVTEVTYKSYTRNKCSHKP